jgi:hypothetical protein
LKTFFCIKLHIKSEHQPHSLSLIDRKESFYLTSFIFYPSSRPFFDVSDAFFFGEATLGVLTLGIMTCGFMALGREY